MTVREASCPGCGATLSFRNAATLYVVCPHCGGASARTDVDLALLGKVAQVAAVDSVLSLGAEGRTAEGRWRAVGVLRLDHGAGPWNEWCLSFEDGSWAWLAEAQGELLLTREAPAEGVRPPQALAPAAEETIGGVAYVVAERGEARVVAASGEIPVRATPGTRYAYADLRGQGGRFATVSEGEGALPHVYVGRAVAVEDLGIVPGTVVPAEPARVGAARLACPQCGDTVDVRDPASARVVCPSCGAITDPRDARLRVLGAAAELKTRPAIPIGAVGVLRGSRLEVLGFLVRSVRAGGLWRWREYLLRDEKGRYRWLVESDGHWNLTEPASPGDVRGEGHGSVRWKDRTFRFFQRGDARVDQVLGEVYWEVAVGEQVSTRDYVDPPLMLSFEGTGKERVVSLARYVAGREVREAFGLERLPAVEGVAPNEPNPHPAGQHWKAFGALAAAAILLLVFFHVHHAKRVVYRDTRVLARATPPATGSVPGEWPPTSPWDPPSAPAPPTRDGDAFFTPEFRLEPSSSNVEVSIQPSVLDGWFGLDGAVVALDTGEVRAFQLTSERWIEDGSAESSGDETARIGPLPAGRYALRFLPAAQASGDVSYEVRVRNQVPATGRTWLLVAALLVVPVVSTVLRARFETRRWENSDSDEGATVGTMLGGGDDDE